MTKRERPLSQSQFQIRISSGVGTGAASNTDLTNLYFTAFSGIKDKSQSVQYPDGKRQRLRKMTGARDIEDITISAPFKSEEHQVIIDAWKAYACEELQIEIQPVNCGTSGSNDEVPLGEPFILTGCLWLGCEFPEANREGNEVSRITLSFAIDDWSRGGITTNQANSNGV